MSQSNSSSVSYDSEWQTRLDGELARPMRDRVSALLASSSKISLASVAREVGLSPSFMAALMRDKAIRTRHMHGFNAAIERMEQQAGIRPSGTIPVTIATHATMQVNHADEIVITLRLSRPELLSLAA